MRIINKIFLSLIVLAFVAGCKDKNKDKGIFSGTVIDAATTEALEGVLITIFNNNTNAPVGASVTTDADGIFSIAMDPGTYYAKLTKQGYLDVPPRGIAALAFDIVVEGEEIHDYEMIALEGASSLGWASGQVTDGTVGLGGALVILEAGGKAFSAVTDQEGYYEVYNVPGATYQAKGWLAGYNSASVSVTVSANTESQYNDITLTAGATGSVTGAVKHLATDNKEVDVALIHPVTGESIPGLDTFTEGLTYTISEVPDGFYLARATFKNDDRVMDPDAITKFGEPEVTISGGNSIEVVFDLTNSVTLNTPTNTTDLIPVEVATTTPTFEWTGYSSTSDYVVEVVDAATGNVVWGGFTNSAGAITKNGPLIPSGTHSVAYNSDGSATIATLIPGKIYRWRIYASKDVVSSGTWKLISASEDQKGLFKVTQ